MIDREYLLSLTDEELLAEHKRIMSTAEVIKMMLNYRKSAIEPTESFCEGSCMRIYGEHKGDVKRYRVSGNYFPDMEFNYCDNAVQADRTRRFNVVPIIVTENNNNGK